MDEVIIKPHYLSDNDDYLQMYFIFKVEKPCEDNAGEQGEIVDKTVFQRGNGESHLQSDEEKLQPNGVLEFEKGDIAEDADEVGNKAADTAEYEVGGALQHKLNALNSQNLLFLFY